jgi:hypothetical protein
MQDLLQLASCAGVAAARGERHAPPPLPPRRMPWPRVLFRLASALSVALLRIATRQVAAPEVAVGAGGFDLRVLEAVASTGGGVRGTRAVGGDVSARLCFDGDTALSKICMPRLPAGNAVCGDRACWVIDSSLLEAKAQLVGRRPGLRGVPPPFRCQTSTRAPHLPDAWALLPLVLGTDYVLACATGHGSGEHRGPAGAGGECHAMGGGYHGCRLPHHRWPTAIGQPVLRQCGRSVSLTVKGIHERKAIMLYTHHIHVIATPVFVYYSAQ